MKLEEKNQAIVGNIGALNQILADAAVVSSEGIAAIEEGKLNQAIGTFLSLEERLVEALAFLRATAALHRRAG